MKNIVIISSTPRKNGNSEILANSFAKGAKDAGHKVTTIKLRELSYTFCKGCFACQKTKRCVIKDDVANYLDVIAKADVVVFSSPVYYYAMSGQLKTFIDRLNPIYVTEHNFKDVYLLATAADTNEKTIDALKKEIKGWCTCFEGARLKASLFVGGVSNPGDIKSKEDNLVEAYKLGNTIE